MNNYEYRRRVAGLTQSQAAEKIGVHQTAISQWESGLYSPRANLLPKVAETYGCTVDELLKEEQ